MARDNKLVRGDKVFCRTGLNGLPTIGFFCVTSVDTDQSGSTVFVTKGDTNDAQLELTLASHCLSNSASRHN